MTLRIRAMMLSALMVLAVLAVAPSSNAIQGDPIWADPITLDDTYVTGGTGLLSHGDGNITVTECGTSTTVDDKNIETYGPEGDLIQKISGLSQVGMCQNKGIVGLDGTVFYTKTVNNQPRLTVVKNGVELASHAFSFSCGGTPYGMPQGMKIGADGNLYAVLTNFYSCSRANRLVSLDGQTGAIRFSVDLTGGSEKYQSDETIGVYDNGVVILEDAGSTGSPDYLTYFDYSGTKNNALSCAIHGSTDLCGFGGNLTGEHIPKMVVNSSGTAFIDTYSYGTAPCSVKRRTLRYDTSASASVLTRPSDCDNARMVGVGASDTRFYFSGTTVYAYDPSGSVLYSANTMTKTGFTVHKATTVSGVMSGNGLIVTTRIASPSGSSDKFLYVDELQTNGTWTTLFSTQQFATTGTDTYDYSYAYNVPNVAFADDVMYVAYCSTTCTSGQAAKVVKVDSPGMTMEYPRSEIFAKYTLDNGEQLDYVALGDSFSSGEGVEPFITGTDIDTVNECHRSTKAYPMLLDGDVDTDVNLRSFRACSSATSVTVESGQWNGTTQGGNQLAFLNSDTDIVTLTVGGNNVGFRDFATACVSGILGCDMNDPAYATIMSNISSSAFADELDTLYNSIATELSGNSSARVLVLGYPYVAEPRDGPWTNCSIFDDSFSDTEGEEAAIRSVIDALNGVIEAEVAEMGSQFEFVSATSSGSPFIGHGLCTDDSYFSYVEYGIGMNMEYWFHPTDEGQAAYTSLIESALSN